jgi:hypothetical protein
MTKTGYDKIIACAGQAKDDDLSSFGLTLATLGMSLQSTIPFDKEDSSR